MTITGREKALAAITVTVLLYGATALSARGRIEAWRQKREEYRQAVRQLAEHRALIARAQEWERTYAGMRELMPVFPADRPVDTYWLNLMDQAASRNSLSISRRQVGADVDVGDAHEIEIDCRSWEGTLDALVNYLYDLEAAGVMLDMRQFFVRPNPADHSRLSGTFKLYCAYLREKPAGPPPAAAATGRNVKPKAKK